MKVVVVGAGIIGASIAYSLSKRPGIELTVLERDAAASGATGHSFAWTNAYNKPPQHYHDLNRRSVELWHRFAEALGIPEALSDRGNLMLENTREGAESLHAQVAQLQAWGYPSRLIDSNELAALEPALARHHFTAVCYSPAEAQVDATAAVRACIEAARKRGATVREQAGAAWLHQDSGRVEGVMTPGGRLDCDVVVVAAGTETPLIVRPAGLQIPQTVSPGVVIRTEAQPALLRSVSLIHLPAIDSARREIHLRQLPDGTLQMGQGTQESLDLDDSQAHADDILARAAHYFPALSGATAIPQPVGYRPMPADGLPVIGFTQAVPNLYVAMMHSGVTLAPLAGELAAIEIADGVAVEALAPYRPERFATDSAG